MLVIALALTVSDSPSEAGDFPEHWHLVYYAARVAGYSMDDARLIADASWAVDQNDDTLATGHVQDIQSWAKRIWLNNELYLLPNNEAGLKAAIFSNDGRLLTQGVLLHSLISNTTCGGNSNEPQLDFSARAAARKVYEKYIHDVGQAENLQPDESTRKLRLILTGMYLHFVVDSHVHPEFAIPGHAPSGHQTDYTPNNVHGFAQAGADVYSILVNERQFLAPGEDGSSGATRLTNRDELIRRYGLDNGLLEGITCEGSPSSAYCFFREVVETIAHGYEPYKIGHVDEPKADKIGPLLDELWFRSVSPYVYDNLLGPQRRDTERLPRFVIYNSDMKSGEMTINLPFPTLPKPQRFWKIPSFIRYVEQDRNDEFDGLRESLRQELICQMRSVVATVRNGSLPYLWAQLPAKISDVAATATMNIVVGGSGSSAEKIIDSTWAPQTSNAPLTNSSEVDRPTLKLTDPTRRIIIEVKQRGWATDGLEKYLKPPNSGNQKNETRILVNPSEPDDGAKLKDALNDALKDSAPVSIIVEAPRQTPDSTEQTRAIAQLIDYAAAQHGKQHPDGNRLLYVEGAAADTLRLVQAVDPSKTAGIPAFDKTIAVSPLQNSPAQLPANVGVIMERDNMFMNFDPGSPGYQRLNQRAHQFAKDRDVMIVAASESNSAGATNAARIEYFAKGADEPVTLTNSSLNNVVLTIRPGQDSRQILNSIVQSEGQHKPSDVGGISLVTLARLPLDARTIEGASYDAGSRRIILRKTTGEEWRLPEMNPELVRNAFDCVYGQDLAPELSIGSKPDQATTNRGRAGYARVYYVSAIQNTRLGKIMLDADQFLSVLAFGSSADIEKAGVADLGVHSLPELFPSRYTDNPRGVGSLRVYLVPTRIDLVEATAHDLEFTEPIFDVRFDPSGPAEDEFSRIIGTRWADLLKLDQARPFRELSEAARIVGVFNWLKDQGIAFDDSQLKNVQSGSYFTPSDVSVITLPKIESLNRRPPFNIYGPNGLEKVFDADGKETRIHYRDGQVETVERKDGVTLNTYFDDLGNPAAIAIAGSDLGGAFYRGKANESVNFADQVKLQFKNGKYAGFESVSQSRVLYDVDRTAMVATIIQNFIAEAHQVNAKPSFWTRYTNAIVISAVVVAILLVILWRRKYNRRITPAIP